VKDKIVVTIIPSLLSPFTLWYMACSYCVSCISNCQNSTWSLSISIFVLSSSLSTESISSLVEGEEKFFFYFFLRRKTWEVLVFNFRKINIWLDRKKMQTNFFISINLIFINTTINDLLGIISFNVLTP
jgi:expansin (peptidoglycan-binding protein)